MADRSVYEIGRVTDIDGIPVAVGVDYDTVVIGGLRLDHAAQEIFARFFTAAVWRAAQSLPLTAAPADPLGPDAWKDHQPNCQCPDCVAWRQEVRGRA